MCECLQTEPPAFPQKRLVRSINGIMNAHQISDELERLKRERIDMVV